MAKNETYVRFEKALIARAQQTNPGGPGFGYSSGYALATIESLLEEFPMIAEALEERTKYIIKMIEDTEAEKSAGLTQSA